MDFGNRYNEDKINLLLNQLATKDMTGHKENEELSNEQLTQEVVNDDKKVEAAS